MTAASFPARLTAGLRRVTTGMDANGRAVVAADEIITGDERALLIWSADVPPMMGEATAPPATGWWPPPGGVRVTISSRRPDALASVPATAANAWPDINDTAGFHASCSADVIVVIAGKIWLEMDDGIEVELGAGDTLIQNGTRHRWHNHGDEWPIMAVVIVGAREAGRP